MAGISFTLPLGLIKYFLFDSQYKNAKCIHTKTMPQYIIYEVYYKRGDSTINVFDSTAEFMGYLCALLQDTMLVEDYDRFDISSNMDFSTMPIKTAIDIALAIGRSGRHDWRVVHIAEVQGDMIVYE